MKNMKELTQDLLNSFKAIDDYQNQLKNKLSRLDKRMTDLLHLVEDLDKVKASTSVKLIREMRDIRVERRECKNELKLYQSFQDRKQHIYKKDVRTKLTDKMNEPLPDTYKNRVYSSDFKELFKKNPIKRAEL